MARSKKSGEELGGYLWFVERTLAWLNRLGRLSIRYEGPVDIYPALLASGWLANAGAKYTVVLLGPLPLLLESANVQK